MENSAVEWLVEQIKQNVHNSFEEFESLIEQAKEMENAQRQKDFKAGNDSACMEHEDIEDYFNEYIKSE